MTNILIVSINSPEKLIWEGRAYAVSSVNTEGAFDILPQHANFITLVEKSPINVQTGSRLVSYIFSHAVIYAHENYVQIYTL